MHCRELGFSVYPLRAIKTIDRGERSPERLSGREKTKGSKFEKTTKLSNADDRAGAEVQYYLFAPRDRENFRRKPIVNLTGANGQIIYEQWPAQEVLIPGKVVDINAGENVKIATSSKMGSFYKSLTENVLQHQNPNKLQSGRQKSLRHLFPPRVIDIEDFYHREIFGFLPRKNYPDHDHETGV